MVTFLFTDVEGSAALWERDEERMDAALRGHDRVLQDAVAAHGGHVFSRAGDSFAVAFSSSLEAVAAAVEAQVALREVGLLVRMGLHVGEAHERDGDYFGPAVNRAARLMGAAHGGQLLVSSAVAELVGERLCLRDLGQHRLRDLSATRIWQVVAAGLEEEFPPLRSLDEGRSNLPVLRTSLVGRDREVAALVAALGQRRVVTVTGVGGIGKTRIAVQAAAEALLGFPGGAWLAPLAPVDTAEAVADVVLTAVGGRRQAERSALAALAEIAAGRRLLVVLDNCEHVLDAAAACAEAIVGDGGSVVLATSREPLAVQGEQVFPVPSLGDDAAVVLFAERARAVDPSFDLDDHNLVAVTELCRRLDGMPLAIELAAARVRSMTVSEIADRLRERFRLLRGGPHGVVERHRTLQAAVQWSYGLLTAAQQDVFQRLSVFAGGFTSDAVVAVCGRGVAMDAFDAVDVLDALVARSMVVADRTRAATRYSMLETLRQYGEDLLATAGDLDECRAGHAAHFLAAAEAARQQLSTRDAAGAMARFDEEWDNLRVAFEWFAAAGDVDATLRLVVALYWFAGLSHRYELLPWAERAIAPDRAREHERWPAAAGVTALLRWGTGDLPGAEALAIEALKIEQSIGSPRRFEPALALVTAYFQSWQFERGIQAVPAAAQIAEAGKDPIELGMARAYRVLADIQPPATQLRGCAPDSGDVLGYARDAVRDAEATGNPHQLAFAFLGLLAVATIRQDKALAVESFQDAHRWALIGTNRRVLDNAPLWLADLYHDDPEEALSLVRSALTGFHDTGYWGILDFGLVNAVAPFVQLGRYRAAALALGGMTAQLDTSDPNDPVTRAVTALAETLGPDLDRYLDEGRALTRTALVLLLLAEVDTCLQSR